MGETIDTVFKLPGRYEELSTGLVKRLQEDFSHFGLGLQALYINSITPPADVQKAIDDKSRLAVFDDVNKLLKVKAAMALEKIAETKTEAGAGHRHGPGAHDARLLLGIHETERPDRCHEMPRLPGPRDGRFERSARPAGTSLSSSAAAPSAART